MNEEFNTSAQGNNQESEEEMRNRNTTNDNASLIKDVLNGENGPLYVAITAILAVFGIHSLTKSRYSFRATTPDGVKYSFGPADAHTEEV